MNELSNASLVVNRCEPTHTAPRGWWSSMFSAVDERFMFPTISLYPRNFAKLAQTSEP